MSQQPMPQGGVITTIATFIKRHPVAAYFALTFAISWGGVLLVIGGPGGLPATSEQFSALSPVAIPVMVLGPSVSGILMTALVGGRVGLRDLLSRLLRWRVDARWYAIALLAAPLLMLAVLLALSLTSSAFLPALFVVRDKAARVLFGLFAAVTAGIFEEVGWTGFAIPHLRRRYSVLTTGLIVGMVWAAWHLLVAYWASGTVSGPLSLPSYLLDPFLFLVGFRVLMVWVYDRTGSLLVAMLMHISLTASTLILGAVSLVGGPLITFDLVWAAAVWLVVAAVAAANAGQFSRLPLPSERGRKA
jgi:membrane protease YdiL (CAAX protease family)